MANNKMICEPNTSLPQKIDIDSLRKSDKPYFAAQEVELRMMGMKQFTAQIQSGYNVLPMFHHQNDHLKTVLSLQDNDYLRCRWFQFLNHVPDHYVQIKLYKDFYKKKPSVRRMNLTGQFYGVDNKLAPIPILPDPRKFNALPYFRKECGRRLSR